MKDHDGVIRTWQSLVSGALLLFALFTGCVPLFKGIQELRDMEAPLLENYQQNSSSEISLVFSEDVFADASDLSLRDGGSVLGCSSGSRQIDVSLADCDVPGNAYELEGRVTDGEGNELWFLLPFYGYNDHPANLVINEFINESSTTRLEKAEIYILESGNLGGVTVYNGAASQYRSRFIFAEQEVVQGEYLILHFRCSDDDPSVSGELDEYGEAESAVLNEATAADAVTDIRDFWVRGYAGLSDTNGAVSLYENPSPDSPVIDAVLYSNRSFDPEADYGSFGTAYTWDVMRELSVAGAWTFAGEQITPEDCLKTEDSTSTRSNNRFAPDLDENGPDDWYICDTGLSSFGEENSDIIYEP